MQKQKQNHNSNRTICHFILLGNNQSQNGGYNQGYNSGPMSSGNFGGGGNRRY